MTTKKRNLNLILISLILFVFLASNIAIGQGEDFLNIKGKMAAISQEEREVLEHLFILEQEIENMEYEGLIVSQEIAAKQEEILLLEKKIEEEEINFSDKQNVLKESLRSYQRMGPGTYLEIILDSESLGILLRRLNTLRDLTHNTGQLLEDLKQSRDKLLVEKEDLSSKIIIMNEKQKNLKISIETKLKLADEKEVYLLSLKEEREFFQDHLTNIQRAWQEIQPLFREMMKEFSRVIKSENLPLDAVKTTFTFAGIKGSIDEEVLNNIILDHSSYPGLVFHFYPGKTELRLPEQELIIGGYFVIKNKHQLEFKATEGNLYGLALESTALERLFGETALVLDLKPLLGKNTLDSVKILDGKLELTSKLNIF